MDKSEITEKLEPIIARSDSCGFEAFLLTKTNPRLKKIKLSNNGFHQNLKAKISNTIQEIFLSEDTIFTSVENIVDNQKKYYIIKQTDDYKPFDVSAWISEDFKEDHLSNFMGFLFMFRYDQQEVWCYQNKINITVSNPKKNHLIARLNRFEDGVIFEEQDEKTVTISQKIDMLIIDGNIITNNIGLLERSFDFQDYIHRKAQDAAERVSATGLFSGMDKLNDYLASRVKSHNSYRKKMMKVMESPVLQMTPDVLFEKISTLSRWKGKFKDPLDGKIPIETNKEIELMIDLLIERFTVSEVSGQEYDTEVKKKAKSVE